VYPEGRRIGVEEAQIADDQMNVIMQKVMRSDKALVSHTLSLRKSMFATRIETEW
jgi:hypothetical protein